MAAKKKAIDKSAKADERKFTGLRRF